jgi:hypothetical protein
VSGGVDFTERARMVAAKIAERDDDIEFGSAPAETDQGALETIALIDLNESALQQPTARRQLISDRTDTR